MAFKTYVCDRYPKLKIGTLIPFGGGYKTIEFSEAVLGRYTAKSKEEEDAIENSHSWKAGQVRVFTLPKSDAVDAEEPPSRVTRYK